MLITQKATEYIKNIEKDCTAEKESDDMIRQLQEDVQMVTYKKILKEDHWGLGRVQWKSMCLVCTRHWVKSSAHEKEKERKRKRERKTHLAS